MTQAQHASYLQTGSTTSPFINESGNLLMESGNLLMESGKVLIGSGITPPYSGYSLFHLKSLTGFGTQPVLTTEVCDGFGSQLASIKNFFTDGYINYGIFQTHQPGTILLNYFQDPVKTGNTTFKPGPNHSSVIGLDPDVLNLDIKFNPGNPPFDPVTPLSINVTGITVKSNLVTDNFRMINGAGGNKIMVSDNQGNGMWINPSAFIDNMWNRNAEGELFTLDNVGIGSEDPQDKFQLNDGINKVVMGIGTTDIYDKESSSELTKDPKVVAKENPRMLNSALGYLGFNIVNTPEGWLVSGDGEHNYGSSIFHDFRGSMHFCVIPDSEGEHGDQLFKRSEMFKKIKMSIISSSGYVGIGTASPIEKLDVESDEYTCIRAGSNGPYSAGFRFINKKGGYNIYVDNSGIGRLTEFGVGTIMSFHSGNVDFAGNVGVAGKVGIGAVELSQYSNSTSKLFVEGGITTEAVHVKLQASGWSDFVFADDYKISSISELDQFIKSHKHLPEIPTSSDVEANGIELGKMNALLLQKIEELTLYIIDQQRQINILTSKICN